MKVKIKVPNGDIVRRKIRVEQLGNSQMNIVRYMNNDYLIGSGTEYLRGYEEETRFYRLGMKL